MSFSKAEPLDQLEHKPEETDAEAWERLGAWLEDAFTLPPRRRYGFPPRRLFRLAAKPFRRARRSPLLELDVWQSRVGVAVSQSHQSSRGTLPAYQRNGLRRLGLYAPVPGYDKWSASFGPPDHHRPVSVVVSLFRDVFHVPHPRDLLFAEDDEDLHELVDMPAADDEFANPAEAVIYEWYTKPGARARVTKANRAAWNEYFSDLVDVVDMLGTGDVVRIEPDAGETSSRPYLDVTAGWAAGHLDLTLPIAGTGEFQLVSGAAEHLVALGLTDVGHARYAGSVGYEEEWLETVIVSILRDAFGIKHPRALRRVDLDRHPHGPQLDEVRAEALNLPWGSLEGRDLKPYCDTIEYYRLDALTPEFVAKRCGYDTGVIADLIGHYEEMAMLWRAYLGPELAELVDDQEDGAFEPSGLTLHQGRIGVVREALRLVVEEQERRGRQPTDVDDVLAAYWREDEDD